MNKRAEIWMVFPPDQEYRYGEYPFNTTEERNWVNELAMKIGEERKCKTFVKKYHKGTRMQDETTSITEIERRSSCRREEDWI